MAVLRRCVCNEPLVKEGTRDGDIGRAVLLGTVIAGGPNLTIVCKKCGHRTEVADPTKRAIILPDRIATAS